MENEIDGKDKFTGLSELYEAYRPRYPKEVYAFLRDGLNLTKNSAVADVGAGTGIFSEGLATIGCKLYCVEPNRDMAAVLARKFAGEKNCRVVIASAEETGLDDDSCDLVAAAQAFHWFDGARFKAECARILKPRGNVALVWNFEDRSELYEERFEADRKYCKNFKGFSGGMDGNESAIENFFSCNFKKYSFFNPLRYENAENYVRRCLSASYAPKPNDETYAAYIKEIEAVYNKYSTADGLTVPTHTVLYLGKV